MQLLKRMQNFEMWLQEAAKDLWTWVLMPRVQKNTEISEISNSNSETDDSEGESSCSESGGEDLRDDTIEEEIITDDLFMNTYDIT